MTKMIYVYGDDDYAAMNFEHSAVTVREAYDMAKDHPTGETQITILGGEIGSPYDLEIYVRAYDFGEIDSKFIDFVNSNIVDYDHAKNSDFYFVKEDD